MNFRLFRMGLATLTGWARQGFFIPYRYADGVAEGPARQTYPFIADLFDEERPRFAQLLQQAGAYEADLLRIGQEAPPAPRFNQDWFPTLDALAAYCLIRQHQPRRIMEVGSGHSTRFFAAAVKDGGLKTAITAIDPAPRAVIEGLPVSFHRATLQQVKPDIFDTLESGDMLSMDSSHILMPETDVDIMLNRILPAMPRGLIVHIHDIFLPDPYPQSWEWRGYNEQNAVAPLLTAGYTPLFASHYVATQMPEELAGSIYPDLPKNPDTFPSSLWLIKTG